MTRKKAPRRPIKARKPVHRIDLTRGLPLPEIVAAELAPKILAGDEIKFALADRDTFHSWDWFIALDLAFHRHGAPKWADHVTEGLYTGMVYLGGGEWFAGEYWPQHVVRGELRILFRGDKPVRIGSANDPFSRNLVAPWGTSKRDQSEWEPGERDLNGCETISFTDNRNGLLLADMPVLEPDAEDADVLGEVEAEELWDRILGGGPA